MWMQKTFTLIIGNWQQWHPLSSWPGPALETDIDSSNYDLLLCWVCLQPTRIALHVWSITNRRHPYFWRASDKNWQSMELVCLTAQHVYEEETETWSSSSVYGAFKHSHGVVLINYRLSLCLWSSVCCYVKEGYRVIKEQWPAPIARVTDRL